MTRENKDHPNDLIRINTGYGQLTAPKKLIDRWIKYGWPRGPIMREMTMADSIEGVVFDDRGQVVIDARTE